MFFIFYIAFAFPFWGHGKGAGALSEHLGVRSSEGVLPYRPSYHQPCINTYLPNKKLVDVDKCCSTERERESRDLPL